LITTEKVKAKPTLDMMLVSGRRRWFLLSLKQKYTGIFYLFRSMGEKYVLEKTHMYFSLPAAVPPIIGTFLHTIIVRYKEFYVILDHFQFDYFWMGFADY